LAIFSISAEIRSQKKAKNVRLAFESPKPLCVIRFYQAYCPTSFKKCLKIQNFLSLVEHFGVTPQTIRRDLTELSDTGELDRVHGGAILPSTTVNIAYNERRILNQPSKVDIARACAAMIPNDCAIFLNIGTTTEAVATELLKHEGLLVVTNNVNIASILSANKQVDVVITGGQLRRSDGGLIGEIARNTRPNGL